MKVVQLVTQMEAGGAQRIALLLARELQERGHSVETWFLYRKRASFDGVLGVRVLFEHAPSTVDYFRIIARLFAYLRTHRPDALIAHTHYSNVLGLAIGAVTGVRRRIAVQHSPVAANPRAVRLADWLLGSCALYTHNVTVADSVTESVSRYPTTYRRRVVRIHNGMPAVVDLRSRSDTKALWRLPPAAPLIVNVGRLSAPKNHSVLIDALSMIPDAHLVIVGDGEQREQLERQIARGGLSDRVHLLRELSWEDTMSIVAACDVFAFPSISEALPMALVEAMSLRRAIVASDIAAVRETLGTSGILVPAGSPEAIAAALRDVLGSPSHALAMGEAAAIRARVFSLKTMVDAYERVLSA